MRLSNKRYLYWFSQEAFDSASEQLRGDGYTLESTSLTACQVLNAKDKTLVFAPPSVWSGLCHRQGSWYRKSARRGHTMLLSATELEGFGDNLDSVFSESDFQREDTPSAQELQALVDSDVYRQSKPRAWERLTWLGNMAPKLLFLFNRTWGLGDNVPKHWLGHRANHANFLAKKHTTDVDGQQVAYSVTDNASVCSSCIEFFNVLEPKDRKLVLACPGAVSFGGAKKDVFYDVSPRRLNSVSRND